MKLPLLFLLALLLVVAQRAITQTNGYASGIEQTNKLTIEQAKAKLQQLQNQLANVDF